MLEFFATTRPKHFSPCGELWCGLSAHTIAACDQTAAVRTRKHMHKISGGPSAHNSMWLKGGHTGTQARASRQQYKSKISGGPPAHHWGPSAQSIPPTLWINSWATFIFFTTPKFLSFIFWPPGVRKSGILTIFGHVWPSWRTSWPPPSY